MNKKQLDIDVLICALDNLNQNNLRNGVIDKTEYENYKVYIHRLFDVNKGTLVL